MKLNFKSIADAVDDCKSMYPVFDWVGRRVAVDVGANVGGWTVANLDRFDSIIAVEPHPKTFSYLECNLGNHPRSWHVEPLRMAVYLPWIEPTTIPLFSHKERPSDSGSVTATWGPDWNNESDTYVNTISYQKLLDLCGGYIDYLKCDCEGGEYPFLMDQDLTRVNCLAIELHGQWADLKQSLRSHILQTHSIVDEMALDVHTVGIYRNTNPCQQLLPL